MRSIQRRFNTLKQKHSDLADYTVLMKAVKGQKFTREVIRDWFYKLVEKDDYSDSCKKYLIDELERLTNWSEEPSFKG